MKGQKVHVLIVDDNPPIVKLISEWVTAWGFDALQAMHPREALRLASQEEIDVAVIDLHLPEMDGVELMESIKELDTALEVILVTGDYSVELAVDAIKRGAFDYLCKPINFEDLRKDLNAIREEILRQREIDSLEKALLLNLQFQGMVGGSPAMQSVFAMIRRVAPHDISVLITGATGTGKELAARAVHALGPRSHKPLVACNCSALVESLLESELFGHVKGAFTGAIGNRTGLFEYAHEGTIFLDEIGDLSLPTQAKLLRFLQERQIQRVGSPEVVTVDVRVIAATNRHLKERVQQDLFREDLYHRLNMIEIHMPSLAERREDIPFLSQFFLSIFSAKFGKSIQGLSKAAQQLLVQYNWPGNVRELENVIGRACILADQDIIDVPHLSLSPEESIRVPVRQPPVTVNWGNPAGTAKIGRKEIEEALTSTGGNRIKAADSLRVSRRTLYRLMRRFQLPSARELAKEKEVPS